MSKAFTDEEAQAPPALVRPRAPLPDGVPNYVTARGLEALREELARLAAECAEAQRAISAAERAPLLAARRAELEQRIASAEVVAPPAERDAVRFGARVTLRSPRGEHRYRIVGVDEADAAQGTIAFVAPLARALMGRAVGERVRLRAPGGSEELQILAIEYEG